jgi:hypothetical protein
MNKPNLFAIGFAVGYLLLSLFISSLGSEGGWGGGIMFFLAFPFSILSIVVSGYMGSYFTYFVMNALWWYLMVRLFCYIYMNHRRK